MTHQLYFAPKIKFVALIDRNLHKFKFVVEVRKIGHFSALRALIFAPLLAI